MSSVVKRDFCVENRETFPLINASCSVFYCLGPKMAFLALQCAWDINAGVGVDVHVHRITK